MSASILEQREPRAFAAPTLRTLRVGLLGCGTVGREIARLLTDERARLERAVGARLELTPILVRRPERERGLRGVHFTHDVNAVLDARPDIVIELLGGIEPARSIIRCALSAGIPVVTANKTLLAHHGDELLALAEVHGVGLRAEACVGGATPILATLAALAVDRARSIVSIVNGSCNAILDSILEDGRTRMEAIAEAQARGLLEPDPSADLSGRDSAEKLCVLARAVGAALAPEDVACEGIERIDRADLVFARRWGHRLRLVARWRKRADGSSSSRVSPCLVPADDSLGRLRGARNIFILETDLAGRTELAGVGAGPRATSSAVLADLVHLARDPARSIWPDQVPVHALSPEDAALAPDESPRCTDDGDDEDDLRAWYVRLPRSPSLTPSRLCDLAAEYAIELGPIDYAPEAIRFLIRPARETTVRALVDRARGDADEDDVLLAAEV